MITKEDLINKGWEYRYNVSTPNFIERWEKGDSHIYVMDKGASVKAWHPIEGQFMKDDALVKKGEL